VTPDNRWSGPSTAGGYALRAREGSVRPRRLVGAAGRPLNFTVRSHRRAPCQNLTTSTVTDL
jgi:hypothetical protein